MVKSDKKTRNQTRGVKILTKVVILDSSGGYLVHMYQGAYSLPNVTSHSYLKQDKTLSKWRIDVTTCDRQTNRLTDLRTAGIARVAIRQ